MASRIDILVTQLLAARHSIDAVLMELTGEDEDCPHANKEVISTMGDKHMKYRCSDCKAEWTEGGE